MKLVLEVSQRLQPHRTSMKQGLFIHNFFRGPDVFLASVSTPAPNRPPAVRIDSRSFFGNGWYRANHCGAAENCTTFLPAMAGAIFQ